MPGFTNARFRSSTMHLFVLVAIVIASIFTPVPAAATQPPGTSYQPAAPAKTRSGALFMNGTGNTSSTNSASVRVDANGGTHVAFAGYYTGLNSTNDTTAVYYSYCAPAADCSKLQNWARLSLGDSVQEVQLELTPEGHPRMLLLLVDQSMSSNGYSTYWYGSCDANCTSSRSWTFIDIANTTIIDLKIWESPNHYFALDSQGNPRFVFGSGIVILAFCNEKCTDTTDDSSGTAIPSNWYYAHVSDALYLNQPSLAFTPDGRPRILGFAYDPNDMSSTVDYLECNDRCGNANGWTVTPIAQQGNGTSSLVLRTDSQGRPRLALFQNNHLVYGWCNEGCTQAKNWSGATLGLLDGDGTDPDLVLDAQDHPRLSFGTSSNPQKNDGLGYGLGYAWCNQNCESSNGNWQRKEVETTGQLDHDWYRPAPANCAGAAWFGAFRTSLALDPQGNPRIAYDAEHWFANCVTTMYYYYSVRTDAKAVRLAYFDQTK